MLKKKIGPEAIEKNWPASNVCLCDYYKIPSTLIIPEGCERIGMCAFWGCKKLREVTIPKNIPGQAGRQLHRLVFRGRQAV